VVSCTRSIKRRTRTDMDAIRAAIEKTMVENQPMTVRQVFYAMTTQGVVAKTEGEYRGTVCRLLGEMRRSGDIPYNWLADSTRLMRKPISFSGIQDALLSTARCYRRAVWDDLPVYVEVWCEKDALSGVLYEETSKWDVPLMITRGYPSLTFLSSAAEYIAAVGKPTFIYYFGDHDPSGCDIPRAVEAGLRSMAPDAEINFTVAALTQEQIVDFHLPTRPTKRSDSRARSFEGDSVELDAMPPAALRWWARQCITTHITQGTLEQLQKVEEEERQFLTYFAKKGYENAQ
jgi:hypothetical protein